METEKMYHIYNRGNNKENIFLNEENYIFFLRKYKEYLSDKLDTYAYCLMPNHFHLLAKIKAPASDVFQTSETLLISSVEKGFKDFFISYAKAFNKANDRTGSLFQKKFKKKEINDDAYISSIVAYIHLNPVKANLCSHPSQWKFSSYNSYLSSKPTDIKKEEMLRWYGDLHAFEKFHLDYREEIKIKEYILE